MPLWFDLLCTPMAAPENGSLRRMRRTWQILCISLGAALFRFATLRDLVGPIALPLAGALLLAVLLYTPLYWGRKYLADTMLISAEMQEKAP